MKSKAHGQISNRSGWRRTVVGRMVAVPDRVRWKNGRDLTAECVDTGGPDLGKELNDWGSGGRDVSGTCIVVGELEAGVGRGKLGDRPTSVGGGASWKPTGCGGDAGGVADDGIGRGAVGKNERRLEDNPVV